MIRWLIYGMIYAGSALMVYNIVGFTRFVRYIQKRGNWENNQVMLYIPVILLCLFLLGYLGVGLFGKPDLLNAGILFGGSIFVYVMYQLLSRITEQIIRNEHLFLKRVVRSIMEERTNLPSALQCLPDFF